MSGHAVTIYCEWGVLGNNKRIQYSDAVESERTKFDCIRTLRTTRKISKYNTSWPCPHEKKSIRVGGIFSFFLPQFSSANLWLDDCLWSGYWGWHCEHRLFTSHLYSSAFFAPRHKRDVVLLQTLSKHVIQPYGWRREPWTSHRRSANFEKTSIKAVSMNFLSSLHH